MIGPVKVLIDAYLAGELDKVYLVYTNFINTMKQEATLEQLLPLTGERMGAPENTWDYLYEPDAAGRHRRTAAALPESQMPLVYQAVAENMASEQSCPHGGHEGRLGQRRYGLIKDLQLVWRSTRRVRNSDHQRDFGKSSAAPQRV